MARGGQHAGGAELDADGAEVDPADVETRAGFLEHDGGLTRSAAERLAAAEVGDLPGAWVEGVLRLGAMPPPTGFAAGEWWRVVADATALLERWGPAAARLGWPAWALWGAHRSAPRWRLDGAGLALLLHGQPVIAMTAAEAVIRTASGQTLTYRRPARDPLRPAERRLLWELI